MAKTKITYILSSIDKAIAFEWIVNGLNQKLFELEFIFLNPIEPYLYTWLQERCVKAHFVKHHGKKDYLKSISKVLRLLRKSKPDIVHCHLLDANIIGLVASKTLGIKKRIYTRHHSTFHHDYFPNAVKYDRLCNRLATDVVAISENVKKVLIERENCRVEKIHLIHHGFDLDKFRPQNVKENLKTKYGLGKKDFPVIGVVSRYINWKGIKYIIRAFHELLEVHPNAKLVLANAYGPGSLVVKKELSQLPESSFVEIKFEQNLFALYQMFDVYVHAPINSEVEAFGQTYVEALAAGIPSVFTLSGVANEFIENEKNAIVVPYEDSKSIYKGVKILLNQPEVRINLIENGLVSVQKFNLADFIDKLESLYLK